MVYVLVVVSALIVAAGEVIQQNSASQAPPEQNLSFRLLLWLVQRPMWLLGVVCSFGGNAVFASAEAHGSVAVIEAVFVVRLIFGLVMSAAWRRRWMTRRDVLGAAAIAAGLIGFLLAAEPTKGEAAASELGWVIGGGAVVAFALLLAVVASRLGPARKATLLGAGAGALFGLQASLMQSAVHVITRQGVVALLTTWNGYAVAAVALLGMLLVQSAFEAAPLAASYPSVVTTELVAGIAVGVWLLGGSLELSPLRIAITLVGLIVLVAGVYLLTTSPLVTGELDTLIRRQDVGQAKQIEARVSQEIERAQRYAERADTRVGGVRPMGWWDQWRLDRELRRIDEGVDRLCALRDDSRRHRDAEQQRLNDVPEQQRNKLEAQDRELREQERRIAEHADELRERADQLAEHCGRGGGPEQRRAARAAQAGPGTDPR